MCIRDSDNGVTNFHFEISADLLNQEELELISDTLNVTRVDFPPYLYPLKSALLITCRMYYINTHDYLYSAIRLKLLLSHIYLSLIHI